MGIYEDEDQNQGLSETNSTVNVVRGFSKVKDVANNSESSSMGKNSVGEFDALDSSMAGTVSPSDQMGLNMGQNAASASVSGSTAGIQSMEVTASAGGAGAATASTSIGGTAAAAGATAGAASVAGASSAGAAGTAITGVVSASAAPIIIAVVIVIVLFVIFFAIMLYMMPGSSQSYQDTEYGNQDEVVPAKVNYNFTNNNLEIVNTPYDYAHPYMQGSTLYSEAIESALEKSFSSYCIGQINELKPTAFENLINFFKGLAKKPYHKKQATLDFFLNENPYPYNLRLSRNSFYTVRDYLNTVRKAGSLDDGDVKIDFTGARVIPENELNNDINFAEILSVFGQEEKLNWKTCKYEDYVAFLNSETTQKLFYEMYVEEENPVYVITCKKPEQYTDDEGIVQTRIRSKTIEKQFGGVEFEFDPEKEFGPGWKLDEVYFYYKIYVMPYGLRELYEMIKGSEWETFLEATNETFHFQTNRGLINYNELYLRTYVREEKPDPISPDRPYDIYERSNLYLGPDYREERSPLSVTRTPPDISKEHVVNTTANGRSPVFYFEISINDGYSTEEDIPEWDEGEPIPKEEIAYPDESVILDMPVYINQGDYPDSLRGCFLHSIKTEGCMDCSYTMCYDYFFRENLAISYVSLSYVLTTCQMDGVRFCADHGMNVTGDTLYSQAPIMSEIREGNPVILHIKGYWNYGGKKYHGTSNGHFLVIMGYDTNGFYVYDPGMRSNTYANGTGEPIPYEAFTHGGLISCNYRVIHKLTGSPRMFLSGHEPK